MKNAIATITNLFRKNDRTAAVTALDTTESTPFATRSVKVEREINVYTGTISVVGKTYGEWSLKSGVVLT